MPKALIVLGVISLVCVIIIVIAIAVQNRSTGSGGGTRRPHLPSFGNGLKKLLGILKWVVIVVLLVWLAPKVWHWLEGLDDDAAHASSSDAPVFVGTAHAVRGPTVIDCAGDNAITAVIKPGNSVHVRVPDRTYMDSKPDVAGGNISKCSFSNPNRCLEPGGTLNGDIDIFTVTNLSSGPDAKSVNFTCSYRPMLKVP